MPNLNPSDIQVFTDRIKQNPNATEPYVRWGLALHELAKREADPEIFSASFDKFSQAISIDSNATDAYNNWGNALSDLAQLKKDRALYESALDKFSTAVKIRSNSFELLSNWGLTLLNIATLFGEPHLLDTSKEKLLIAKSLNPTDTYNLACYFACTGDFKACREELLNCKDHGTLPDKPYLESDDDLKNVHGLEWFQELSYL
ncbi:MAG: hypothetical protein ACSHXY_05500 [Alphaproteobacteria bacterium]